MTLNRKITGNARAILHRRADELGAEVSVRRFVADAKADESHTEFSVFAMLDGTTFLHSTNDTTKGGADVEMMMVQRSKHLGKFGQVTASKKQG